MTERGAPAEGDLVWRRPNTGFVGPSGWAVVADMREDPWPCICGREGCVEIDTLHCLPGNTEAEARAALDRGEFLGMACHVGSLCGLGGPGEWHPDGHKREA